MKKFLALFIITILALITACGENEEPAEEANADVEVEANENAEGVTEGSKDSKESEPTQEELNEQLKAEAVQADFVELNNDNAEENKKVFSVGEVTHIAKEGMLGEFTLTTEEDDGYGMYTISNFTEVEVAEGDNVKVYGVTSGKDDLGVPVINATIIEK